MEVDGISRGLSSRTLIGVHSTPVINVNSPQPVSNEYHDVVTLSPQAKELYKSNSLQKINPPISINAEDITNIVSSAANSGKNVKILVTPDSYSIEVTFPPIQDTIGHFVKALLNKTWSLICG